MVDEVSAVPSIARVQTVGSAPLKSASQIAAQIALNQEESTEAFENYVEQLSNPLQRFSVQSNLTERVRRTKEKERTSAEELEVPEAIEGVGDVEGTAARFHKRNTELNDRVLTLLWQRVQGAQTEDEILDIVQEFYPDPSLADDALEFLLAAEPEMARRALIEKARDKLHKRYEKEIRAGKNISTVARAFAAKGLKTPTSLRALYRYILDNPKEPTELFEELASKFSYDELKDVIKFLVHSLNADLKALAPSLEPSELRLYMGQCRVLSAILGVYYFFLKNFRTIRRQFALSQIPYPAEDTFEVLARTFCRLVDDRYPNAPKILQLAPGLHVQGNFAAQLILYYLFGRAINEVAPRLFRSEQAKQALRDAFVEATEQIENQIDTNERDKLKKMLLAQIRERKPKKTDSPSPPKDNNRRSEDSALEPPSSPALPDNPLSQPTEQSDDNNLEPSSFEEGPHGA